MGTDYIPSSDAEFNTWLKNFELYVGANAAALGISPAQVTQLNTVTTDWATKYLDANTKQATAASAIQAKKDSRRVTEDFVRPLVGAMQSNTAVTDAHRQSLNITVRSTSRTAVGPPETSPVAQVDTSQRLRHTLSFSDERTPTSRSKPPGVQGCEIWTKVGDPAPTGPQDVHYLALDTRTPYVAEFEAADAGKKAYYMLRWISTRGEPGPWSQTVSGTITN
jgi:hypothetical protein